MSLMAYCDFTYDSPPGGTVGGIANTIKENQFKYIGYVNNSKCGGAALCTRVKVSAFDNFGATTATSCGVECQHFRRTRCETFFQQVIACTGSSDCTYKDCTYNHTVNNGRCILIDEEKMC